MRLVGDKCGIKPSGVQAARGLRRMKEGLHPISGKPQAQTRELPPSFVEGEAEDCLMPDIQEVMENQGQDVT